MDIKKQDEIRDSESRGEDQASQGGERPLSRRQWLALSLASLAAGSLASEVRFAFKRQGLLESYGDLDNPRYRVREDLGYGNNPPTYQTMLREKMTRLDVPEGVERKLNTLIDTLHEELAKVPGLLSKGNDQAQGNKDQSPEAIARAFDEFNATSNAGGRTPKPPAFQVVSKVSEQEAKISRWLSEQRTRITELSLDDLEQTIKVQESRQKLSALSYTQHAEEYGPPVAYVRGLVEQVTGIALPDKIDFKIRPIDDPNVLGVAYTLSQSIISEDGYYGDVVLTLAHEAGHLMAPHQEHLIIHGTGGVPEGTVSNWEEACAYAFQTVAAESLQNTPLKLSYAFHILYCKQFLSDFYEGRQSDECHRVGMAYFDAAQTVLGSSAKAYNFLSSHRALTPEMEKVIEDNRAFTDEMRAIEGAGSPRLTRLQERCAGLARAVKKADQQITSSSTGGK